MYPMLEECPELAKACPVLNEMLRTGVTLSPTGDRVPMTSGIIPLYAEALYKAILKFSPAVVVEIGMAFGVSTLAILSALKENNPAAKLISIDPEQSKDWKDCGRHAVARAGLADQHIMIENFDYLTLPTLCEKKLLIDFAYIDGWHTFDYTLLDWWYIDKMLKVGGIVGFNDCGWPAVEKVIKFVLSHRNYKEISVGLPMVKWDQAPQRCEDRYFIKVDNTEPRWDFFAEF